MTKLLSRLSARFWLVFAAGTTGCAALICGASTATNGFDGMLGAVAALALSAVIVSTCTRLTQRPPPTDDAPSGEFASAVDTIMLGGAETSHFVDTAKKALQRQLNLASAMASTSEEIARTTEQMATNVKRAAAVASEVTQQCALGKAESQRGLVSATAASSQATNAAIAMATAPVLG
jgi:hypothetical protein